MHKPNPTTSLTWEVLPIDSERGYCSRCDEVKAVMLGRDYKGRPKRQLCLECYSLRLAGVKIGTMGGIQKSEKKAASSRENGKKGGRPKKIRPVPVEVKEKPKRKPRKPRKR